MRTLFTVLIALGLMTQCLLPALVLAQETAAVRQGLVTADRLNLRDGAGTQFAVIGAAGRGEAVAVLEESEDWFRVRLADGRTGWVAAKYVEIVAAAPAETPPAGDDEQRRAVREEREPEGKQAGGGSFLGTVLKWGCFFGAAAGAGLAYNEHSLGNDSYDQYKDMVLKEGKTPAESEFRRLEAIDHDDKATIYAIGGGVLFGAFLVQQFFLGGGQGDQASLTEPPGAIALGLSGRQVRAGVVLARF